MTTSSQVHWHGLGGIGWTRSRDAGRMRSGRAGVGAAAAAHVSRPSRGHAQRGRGTEAGRGRVSPPVRVRQVELLHISQRLHLWSRHKPRFVPGKLLRVSYLLQLRVRTKSFLAVTKEAIIILMYLSVVECYFIPLSCCQSSLPL